jgi:hypothetical protein
MPSHAHTPRAAHKNIFTSQQEKARLRAEDAALLASVTPGVAGVEQALAALQEACGGDRKVGRWYGTKWALERLGGA